VYALSVESILLNSECQVKIQIRNTGAALTSDQHAESNVRMGGKSAVSLARLDPSGRLKTAGKLVGFVDEQPLSADTDYLVEVTLFNGKSVSQRSLLKPRCSGPARTERPATTISQTVAGHDPSKARPERSLPTPGHIAAGHQAAVAASSSTPMRFKPQPFIPALADAPITLEVQRGGGEFADWVTEMPLDSPLPVLFRWTTLNPDVKFARWEVSTQPFAPGAVPEDWRVPILAKGSAGAAPGKDRYQTFPIDFSTFAPAAAPSTPVRYFVRVRPSRMQLAVVGGSATTVSDAIPQEVPGVASAPVLVVYASPETEQTVFDNLPPSPYEVDHDLDGIPDMAEYDIAWKFKPYFVFDSDEGNRRPDEPVVLFQVRPTGCSGRGCPGPISAHIRYFMLWAEDGGYGPSSDCTDSHHGDNQSVDILVESTDSNPYSTAWKAKVVQMNHLTWPLMSARFGADVLRRETHVTIYMSAHKHHQYFDTANDEQDSEYSDFGCNDDVNGEGAVVFANLLSPHDRPNNVGEVESHPAGHFVDMLDDHGYPGECAWCGKDFKGGLGDDGGDTSPLGWRDDPFHIRK
jgi:hypothetical protein